LERLGYPVSGEESGERLDQFVTRLTGMTRAQAQRLISSGAVRVNGSAQPKHYRLRPGDYVGVEPFEPQPAEPVAQSIPINIVYQDKCLAVISKPAGLVVHPAAGHREGTLVNALLYAIEDLSGVGGVLRPGIVHRLDRDTSGLMVVAKNDSSHATLQKMVRGRELKRLYLALVHGVPATRLATIDAPVGRNPGNRKKMAVTGEGGRPALTHFQVIKHYPEAALLEVELVTGRTHQIRVHLAYIGYPVVGDPEYGIHGALERELELKRQFLHAYKISFPHPETGEELSFEDPLPEDLESALRRLESM
jgi:23S rRNA pseudouridine1911/1915/1917 synthase